MVSRKMQRCKVEDVELVVYCVLSLDRVAQEV
jgi:hypothetical protein